MSISNIWSEELDMSQIQSEVSLITESHIQGSKKWLALRKTKITATDACAIMGTSPWKTREQLLIEKTSDDVDSISNEYIIRGLDLEELARDLFIIKSGLQMYPKVVISKKRPWAMCSLDGISLCSRYILEIKCPGKRDHNTALKNEIPKKYYPQIQHSIEVCEVEKLFYFSFDGFDGTIVEVNRNQGYIDKLFEEEKKFFDEMTCLLKKRAAM